MREGKTRNGGKRYRTKIGCGRFSRYTYHATLFEVEEAIRRLILQAGECTLEVWSVMGGWEPESIHELEDRRYIRL